MPHRLVLCERGQSPGGNIWVHRHVVHELELDLKFYCLRPVIWAAALGGIPAVMRAAKSKLSWKPTFHYG